MRLPGFPVDVAPFTRFEPEALALLDAHLRRETFPAGAVLVSPSQGDASRLFVLGAGRVRGRGGATGDADLDLGRGALFPVGALSGRRPSANTYVAETEVEAFTLPAEQFHRLLETSPAFSSYCGSYLARLVSESRRQAQARSAEQASDELALDVPLSQLVKRAPVVVDETDSILRAVEVMHAHKTGSVVITARGAPVGILTQSDVVYRVVLARVALECLVSEVMTPKPATLLDTATAADAMFALAARGVRHLVVVDGAGQVTGVVSEHDLFALQRSSVARARRAVEAAPDVPAVARVVRDVRRAATAMLDQGAGAAQLTQFLTSLNDAATRRVLELCLARADLGEVRWAWLAFGSEGRGEQTLATDQDNGLVFVVPTGGDVEATRARLLTFAREVNDALDACGFARCEGGIMAGNALWCLSLDEWKARFAGWITAPSPEALLHASIFFDFRALLGDVELGERLHAHLAGLAPQHGLFLRALAANALSVAPPLGLFRDFTTERDAEGRACVDLKKYGARLFVDAARVLALANGLTVAATRSRLSQSARLRGGAGTEVDALIEAFDFVQVLRLRHQHRQALAGRAQDNLVPVDELSSLERRILKEALRQAKDLQVRLKLNYQL